LNSFYFLALFLLNYSWVCRGNEQLNNLVVSINEERLKSNNTVTINANELRENLMNLSKSLHNQLAGHLDKWIQYGLRVEPANRLPQAA
jgi:hypothetical protein